MKIFLCHSSRDSAFVVEVAKYLKHSLEDLYYYEDYQRSDESFSATISRALEESTGFVLFFGPSTCSSPYQLSEANTAFNLLLKSQKDPGKARHLMLVYLDEASETDLPKELSQLGTFPLTKVSTRPSKEISPSNEAYRVAKEVLSRFTQPWRSDDDLPDSGYLFDYEKDIIGYFIDKARLDRAIESLRTRLAEVREASTEYKELETQHLALQREYDAKILPEQLKGCPASWPTVKTYFTSKDLLEARLADLESDPGKPVPDTPRDKDKVGKFSKLEEEDRKEIAGTLASAGQDEQLPPPRRPKETLLHKNEVPEDIIGKPRSPDAKVLAAALSSFHCSYCMLENELAFPEAGPREYLVYPQPGEPLKVGIVVSGGIAPGTNAVIDGITQRHHLYADYHKYTVQVYGYRNGFQAFDSIDDSQSLLDTKMTSEHASEGGSLLGTSRYEGLLDKATRHTKLDHIVSQLVDRSKVDILYVIGGDGSMRAAHAIWSYANQREGRKLSVVAIPKTMDNDILWVWQTFGFQTAVERARELIEDLAIEVASNPRLGVVQLFGSDSGYIVSHAVLASKTGICDAALIPEVDFSIEVLARYLRDRIVDRANGQKTRIPSGFVVLGETAIPTDALKFIDDPNIELSLEEKQAVIEFDAKRSKGGRIEGQTNDALRTAGLKIVSLGLLQKLPSRRTGQSRYSVQPNWNKLRIFTNAPRHLLRTRPPATIDIINAQRLGLLAVDNALAGYTDFMVSQWLTEYVLVPLKLVALGRKRIPTGGIFWKSVLAKTGQPFKMT